MIEFKVTKLMEFASNHLYLILFIPLSLIIYQLLPPGVVMFGDFPLLETSLYSSKFLSTWIDYGSHYGFETLSRYPFIFFGYLLNTLGAEPGLISKFLVVLGFATASFTFYFSFNFFARLKSRYSFASYRIAAVVGSLFYAYNVWSFHRIHHWYLWFGYALLPLFLVLLYCTFRYPSKWKYVLATVFLWSLVSAYPHMVIFYGLFFVGFSGLSLLRIIRHKEPISNVIKPILLIMALYVLINVYWIYPYFMYIANSGELINPSLYLAEEYTMELSDDSSFLNVLRLIEDPWQPKIIDVNPIPGSTEYQLWFIASFVFPILAFSAILLKRNAKYVTLFAIIAAVGILLTIGTNVPFNFYLILLFEAPLPSIVRFLFREPDKWALFIALSYSFLLSIASIQILQRASLSRYKNIISCIFILLIGVSFIIFLYPVYQSTSDEMISPIVMPQEYDKLNSYLTNTSTERVFYLGQEFQPRIWNEGRYFCCLDEVASSKPNIDTYLANSENYHNYIRDYIIYSKNSNISNVVFPLETKYLLYSNDELLMNSTRFLNNIASLKDLTHVKDIGFFKIFKTEERNKLGEFNIPKRNMLLTGGLDTFTSLSFIPSFTSANFSMLFLDQSLDLNQKYLKMNFGDTFVATGDKYDYIFSFLDKKYVISPGDYTNHGGITEFWSKDSALSRGFYKFHFYATTLGIQNWNFDYGRGLAMAETVGANLTMPISIESTGATDDNNNEYQIFMRYFMNQKGGSLKVLIDGKPVSQITTLNKMSSGFKWEKVGSINLTEGKHAVTLENLAGLNAVNILAIVPNVEIKRLEAESSSLFERDVHVMHLLEAESNFHNNKGVDTGIFYDLLGNGTDTNTNNSSTTSFIGSFKTPANSNLLSLEFLGNKSNGSNGISIKDLLVKSANTRFNILSSELEAGRELKSYTTFSDFDWDNHNKDMLSLNSNATLDVNIKKGQFDHWGVVTTDYIPVSREVFYNYTQEVVAEDVNQLHTKVYYFDGNRKEIQSNFVFGGIDGTFDKNFNKIILPPTDARFMKLQLWVAPNAQVNSGFTLKNANLQEIPAIFYWFNNDRDILSVTETNSTNSTGNGLDVQINPGEFSHWGVVTSDFIPINENAYYDFTIDVKARDVSQLHSKVYYYDSTKSLETKESEYLIDGADGSFEKNFKKYITPQIGTKFLKIQVWVKPNPEKASSYELKNVKLDEINPTGIVFNGSYYSVQQEGYQNQKQLTSANNSLFDKESITKPHNKSYIKELPIDEWNPNKFDIRTIPGVIEPNRVYDYRLTVDSENITSLSGTAFFKNSDDVLLNSKYGSNASRGIVLSMSPDSQVSGTLDILRPSNYTIAVRAKTCDGCNSLELSLLNGGDFSNKSNLQTIKYSLNDKQNTLKWIYSNDTFSLDKGTYQLRVNSDSYVDLDSILVYSVDNTLENASELTHGKTHYNTLEDFFNQDSYPATISKYIKLDSTKYVVNITNATRPYIISFAEGYDSLWKANIDGHGEIGNNETAYISNSIPIYSFINGYFINKTGDYSVSLEYQPHKWFVEAGIISLLTLVGCLLIYLFGLRQKASKFFKYFLSSLSQDKNKNNIN